MSLIIIEGVDGSGKTTLMDRLAKEMADDTIELHSGPLKRHPLDEYVMRLMQYRPDQDSKDVVADRWHLGELVYGPLYRGESAVTPLLLDFIDMFLDSRGALRLVMTTPFGVVMRRIQERGEDFVQPQHMRLIHDFYSGFAANPGWTGVRSPVSSAGTKRIVKEADERAEAVMALDQTYVGKPDAKYVFHLPRVNHPVAGMPVSRDSDGHVLLAAARMVEGLHGNFAMTFEKHKNSNLTARHFVLPPDFLSDGASAAALKLEKILR